jgi:hypothetical protein
MWIIMCDDKSFLIYLNSGPMLKDLLLKHEGEGK